jgi:hypothetical protein
MVSLYRVYIPGIIKAILSQLSGMTVFKVQLRQKGVSVSLASSPEDSDRIDAA